MKGIRIFTIIIFSLLAFNIYGINLLNIQHNIITGNKSEIAVEFNQTPIIGKEFTIHEPYGVVFDFLNTQSLVQKEALAELIQSDIVRNINVVSQKKGTRLVINLAKATKHKTSIVGNKLIITFDNVTRDYSVNSIKEDVGHNFIETIDFRRDQDEGRLILQVANKDLQVNIKNVEKNKIVLDFPGVKIANNLARIYDVRDFGSPVQQIKVNKTNNAVVMDIMLTGNYEHSSYQINNQYVFAAKYSDPTDNSKAKNKDINFTGEKISLNFQNISVRSVLQILANFTNMNMVVTDEVQGSITLRLNNVPWDQALEFILKAKGLGQKRSGNILVVAPQGTLDKQEEDELAVRDRVDNLKPLLTEIISVNYAKAKDVANILKSKENSLLSTRGQITVDERTNTLLIKDTGKNIIAIREMLEKLDLPVKQVLIEAQIVTANIDWQEYFGMAIHTAAKAKVGGSPIGISDTLAKSQTIRDSYGITNNELGKMFSGGNFAPVLPGAGPGGGVVGASVGGVFDISVGKLPGGTLLDLELSALEAETKTHYISRPRVITQDQQAATISSGSQIPYQSTAPGAAGGTITVYKAANTSLDITPQITPNNKILLKIVINSDTPKRNDFQINAEPIIEGKNVTTNLLLSNGETAVLGGVLTDNYDFTKYRIPVLSELPLLGRLFRKEMESNKKTEISFFITPRIVSSGEK